MTPEREQHYRKLIKLAFRLVDKKIIKEISYYKDMHDCLELIDSLREEISRIKTLAKKQSVENYTQKGKLRNQIIILETKLEFIYNNTVCIGGNKLHADGNCIHCLARLDI